MEISLKNNDFHLLRYHIGWCFHFADFFKIPPIHQLNVIAGMKLPLTIALNLSVTSAVVSLIFFIVLDAVCNVTCDWTSSWSVAINRLDVLDTVDWIKEFKLFQSERFRSPYNWKNILIVHKISDGVESFDLHNFLCKRDSSTFRRRSGEASGFICTPI